MGRTDGVAYWNLDSGAVWVEYALTDSSRPVAGGVTNELAAYDALAAAGFSRRMNWGIVPGNPRRRFLSVTGP